MATIVNKDGPDTITGTDSSDFVTQDTTGDPYYLLGTTDNDIINLGHGNSDDVVQTPGTDRITEDPDNC